MSDYEKPEELKWTLKFNFLSLLKVNDLEILRWLKSKNSFENIFISHRSNNEDTDNLNFGRSDDFTSYQSWTTWWSQPAPSQKGWAWILCKFSNINDNDDFVFYLYSLLYLSILLTGLTWQTRHQLWTICKWSWRQWSYFKGTDQLEGLNDGNAEKCSRPERFLRHARQKRLRHAGTGGETSASWCSTGLYCQQLFHQQRKSQVFSQQNSNGLRERTRFVEPFVDDNGGYPSYLPKRAPAQGFFGMRGKKFGDYDLGGSLNDKRAPMGFMGMRGKKSGPDTFEEEGSDDPQVYDYNYNSIYEKRAPSGFMGMRGKKLSSELNKSPLNPMFR